MRTRRASETEQGGRNRILAHDRTLNKRRRACLGVECEIGGDADAIA